MNLRRGMDVVAGWFVGLLFIAGLARVAAAQADYPFRTPASATINAYPTCWAG